MDSLSDRDKAVLKCIFDPTATIGDVADDEDNFLEHDDEVQSPTNSKAKELSAKGVRLAEEGKLEESLAVLDEAIRLTPDRAAAYNDRAQLYRLMARDDDAMRDIEKALELTSGKRDKARAQALCQQGVLLRKSKKEEEARVSFAEAAKLGSAFARKQVVEMNPYAALCNQMLAQVMKGDKEINL